MKRATFVTVVAFVLVPTGASAGEPTPPSVIPQKARLLSARGRAFHDAGDYGNAIIAFKEAYVMAPSPGLLFNLAQSYRLHGNCDDAALMYRRFLDTGPNPEAREIAARQLSSVERCTRKRGLAIERPPTPPLPAALWAPGPRGAAIPEVQPRTERPRLQKDVGRGVAIGGGAMVAIALYYAIDAHNAATEIEQAYAAGAKWKDLQPIDARGDRSATIATVFSIAGGVAVATGVTLYVLGKRAETASAVAVVPRQRGAEVSVQWRF